MLKTIVKPVLLLLVLLSLDGCAGFFNGREPEEIVRQRIMERWQALIDGRLETAYLYETPEYRELYNFVDFRKRIRGVGVWQKVDITEINCAEKKCIATVQIHVKMKYGMGFEAIETQGEAEENWVKDSKSGQWYHVSNH